VLAYVVAHENEESAEVANRSEYDQEQLEPNQNRLNQLVIHFLSRLSFFFFHKIICFYI